ncbi:c-type cytochrome biogenesis protein CcsB [Desulfococcaceae bacterium HSG8]|nr:c-type cytochrome biogenesis protein CcsB [Desulfococcaceae bacterium HSG8]
MAGILIIVTILFYIFSTAAYAAYLFFQKNYLHKAGCCLMAGGFFCHSGFLGYSIATSGYLPVHNLHGTLSLAGWSVAGIFLIFQYRFNLKVLGIYAAPLVTLIMVISSQLPAEPSQIRDILNNFWMFFHVIVIFMGEASFALACGVGLLYLIQEHSIKNKSHGFFFRRLPSLDLLDTTGYACIVMGFTLLTLGLITGFIYAKLVWGRLWSWDPKEVWSGITWLLYAALLHGRLSTGWRGRKSAIMSVIGFAVLLFTFLGVNFFLKGHHEEFTKW